MGCAGRVSWEWGWGGRQLILGTYRPGLRSLSQRQLGLSVEEALHVGLREWDRTSSYQPTAFYEAAAE